jgi:hypothetical protein
MNPFRFDIASPAPISALAKTMIWGDAIIAQVPFGRRIMPAMKIPRFAQEMAVRLAHARARSVHLSVATLAVLFCFPLTVRAICPKVPHVCTEFFASDSVFSGVVVSERYWSKPHTDGGTCYKLRVKKVYRGQPHEFIEVFTENNSGRLPLEVGHRYLLFASVVEGQLEIGCGGNSGELKGAKGTISKIRKLQERLHSAHGGDIWGVVQLDYSQASKRCRPCELLLRAAGIYTLPAPTERGDFTCMCQWGITLPEWTHQNGPPAWTTMPMMASKQKRASG